jgi:PAS domain S-box-containing protein
MAKPGPERTAGPAGANTFSWYRRIRGVLGRVLDGSRASRFGRRLDALEQSRAAASLELDEARSRINRLEKDLEAERAENRALASALEESEKRFKAVFAANRAVKLIVDPASGAVVDANPAACEFYGYDLETLRAMTLWDVQVGGEERKASLKLPGAQGRACLARRHRTAAGVVRDVEVFASHMDTGGRTLLFAIVHDVTERVQAEKELRRTMEWLREVLASADSVLYRFNVLRDRYDYVSDRVGDLLGVDPEEFKAKGFAQVAADTHPEDWEAVNRRVAEAVAGRDGDRASLVVHYRRRKADGTWVWVRDRTTVLVGENGEWLNIVGVARPADGPADSQARGGEDAPGDGAMADPGPEPEE